MEILTERDVQLLDDLRQVIDAKRRELRAGEARNETKPEDKT